MTWSRQKRQRNPLFREFGAPSACAWMEEGVKPKSKWSGTVAFGPMANPSGSYASHCYQKEYPAGIRRAGSTGPFKKAKMECA